MKSVARTIYKSLLRSTPFPARTGALFDQPTPESIFPPKLCSADELRELVTERFRANQHVTDTAAQRQLINHGFRALKELADRKAAYEAWLKANNSNFEEWQQQRLARADRSGLEQWEKDGGWGCPPAPVKFHLGQVVQHKRHKYRGVVFAWDRLCKQERASEFDDDELDHGFEQPFYLLAPDEAEYEMLMGDRVPSTYVPQEELKLVEDINTEELLQSFYIRRLFMSYSPKYHRYIPSPDLQLEFPDSYPKDDEAIPIESLFPSSSSSSPSASSSSPSSNSIKRLASVLQNLDLNALEPGGSGLIIVPGVGDGAGMAPNINTKLGTGELGALGRLVGQPTSISVPFSLPNPKAVPSSSTSFSTSTITKIPPLPSASSTSSTATANSATSSSSTPRFPRQLPPKINTTLRQDFASLFDFNQHLPPAPSSIDPKDAEISSVTSSTTTTTQDPVPEKRPSA